MNNEIQNNPIPLDILEAIQTSRIYDKLEEIGNRYNLLLDQIGQLEVDTRMTLIGKLKSDSFVSTIAQNLEISNSTAEKIAIDINDEIFDSLKESLRQMQEESEIIPAPKSIPLSSPPPPSSNVLNLSNDKLEKAGGFTIEKSQPSHSPQYNDSLLTKEDVLKEVEEIDKKMGIPDGVSFVDHLLSSPVSSQQEPLAIKVPQAPETKSAPVTPPQPTQKYTIDPYREQF